MTKESDATDSDVLTQAANSGTVQELVDKMKLGKDDIVALELGTRGQGDNPKWLKARYGRVTASNFYRVFTKINTLRKKPNVDMTKLVDSFIRPTDIGHLPQILKGKLLEPIAVKVLIEQLNETHTNLVYTECGLFVDAEMGFIGASPDGIIDCDCHGRALIEIKCPSQTINVLGYLVDGKLKQKSNYYGQVQGQMLVTNIPITYFFVFVSKDEYILDIIPQDKLFCKKLRKNIDVFYTQYLAPHLLSLPTNPAI